MSKTINGIEFRTESYTEISPGLYAAFGDDTPQEFTEYTIDGTPCSSGEYFSRMRTAELEAGIKELEAEKSAVGLRYHNVGSPLSPQEIEEEWRILDRKIQLLKEELEE